jgi:hypothetical protein
MNEEMKYSGVYRQKDIGSGGGMSNEVPYYPNTWKG